MYLDYIIIQIHPLFNEFKKEKIAYNCDPREYIAFLGGIIILDVIMKRNEEMSKRI